MKYEIWKSLEGIFEGISIKSIEVNKENEFYSSIDGVLLNKEENKLIKYPIGNDRTNYEIPSTVNKIDRYSFSNATK